MIGRYVHVASFLIILIFCLTGTAEADSYSACLGQSGLMGVNHSDGNSGKKPQPKRGSIRSAEETKRQRAPKPQFYPKGAADRKCKGCPCRKKKKSRRKRTKSASAKKENEKEVKESQAKTGVRSEYKKAEVRVERVDDIPLLLGIMMQMGLHRILDQYIPKHHKQRDLS